MALHSQPCIKICGVQTTAILDQLIGLGVEYVGFVHFAKSPRHLLMAEIAKLAEKARSKIKSVVLLVDPDDALINQVAHQVHPDFIQLHGHESLHRTQTIKTRHSAIGLIKALPVSTPKDLSAFAAYDEIADLILLDSKPPKDALLPGGRGQAFNWDLLNNLDPSANFMLSGGLDAHNVKKAMAQTHPFALDVSSGVETEKGVKDSGLIEKFVTAVRS